MTQPPDGDTLDALLRSAAPRPLDAATQDHVVAAAWARLHASIGGAAADPGDELQQRRSDLLADREIAARRRRRTARIASVTLAVAVAGAGTAAAADFISTHTGQHTSGWEVDAAGPGELLNMGGDDRAAVFDELTADIPFAPGYEDERAWALDFFPAETDVRMTDSTLRSWMAGLAVCTWADAWVAADDAGNGAAQDAAATVLAEAVEWEDITANDDPDAHITESGEHLSYRWWVRPLAAAAGAGDRAALMDVVAHSATCGYQVIPVIDASSDYEYAGTR
jgi:hypothetical protein